MTSFADAAPGPGLPSHIGRYRITHRIGKGTMGQVFAALDESLGRDVAIKVMMADLQDDPEIRQRFYREAKVTGQLAHSNIVTVFDLGESNGHPYLVMERLNGSTLAEYLRTANAATIDAKIDLMVQVLEGLQVAHSRGVIHRDIKPSNLFVLYDGTLKILDFGVARLASSSLTLSGLMVGTPEYISPEQAKGHQVDARSDLFSAAGVFYFMLTGRGPFSLGDLPQVLHAVLHEDPPPIPEDAAPPLVNRIVMKALSKSPADRYQQCADMITEFHRVRRVSDGTTHRIALAALDRYRQVLAVIEERRALGVSLGIEGIEGACDGAITRLGARFPLLARHVEAATLVEPFDRAEASAALESLKARHNQELAALAALQEQATDTFKPTEPLDAGGAPDPSPDSARGSILRRIVPTRGRT